MRWTPCYISVTTGHTLTSAVLALIRRQTATSRTAVPPTWSGARPLQPTASLEDPAWGPQDPCPCCLCWFFGSVTGQEASLPPLSQKTLQRSGWGGGGGAGQGKARHSWEVGEGAAGVCGSRGLGWGPCDRAAVTVFRCFFSLSLSVR